jgi:hypothetical protein
MAETSPTPNLLWRLFVLVGMGTMGAVTVDDSAWEAFDDATGQTLSRDAIRALFIGTVAVHSAEAMSAYGSARRAGVRRPLRWGLSTFMWGFPVLLRLRRAKRQAAA